MSTIYHTNCPISYTAKWPKGLEPTQESLWAKVKRVAWNILSVIIFPIGLCRIAYWAMRKVAFLIILPGCLGISQLAISHRGKMLIKNFNGQSLTLTTPDGVKIDGAFFEGANPKKAIIYAGGNAQQWEMGFPDIPEGPSLLMLNPRGIGNSTGARSPEQSALDIYTAYKFLIEDRGLDPENILLLGMSMGGAYGALGASLIQKEYPHKKISMINRNSFGDLGSEIQAILGKVLGWTVTKLLGLDLDIKPAWESLKGKKVIFYHPDDNIIPYSASLAKAVKDDRNTTCYKNPSSGHNDGLVEEVKKIYDFTIDEILNLSTHVRAV